nr:hypothetical protein Iba_chr13cCG16690 [Ipomoea batatas]
METDSLSERGSPEDGDLLQRSTKKTKRSTERKETLIRNSSPKPAPRHLMPSGLHPQRHSGQAVTP